MIPNSREYTVAKIARGALELATIGFDRLLLSNNP